MTSTFVERTRMWSLENEASSSDDTGRRDEMLAFHDNAMMAEAPPALAQHDNYHRASASFESASTLSSVQQEVGILTKAQAPVGNNKNNTTTRMPSRSSRRKATAPFPSFPETVPSTLTGLRRCKIEKDAEGFPVRPELEYFNRSLRPSTTIPGLSRERLVNDLDMSLQRRAWSAGTIGGDPVRAAVAITKPLTKFQLMLQRRAQNTLFPQAKEECEEAAERLLERLDDWMTQYKLRVVDLFRRHDFNKGNKGRGADFSDNVLDLAEASEILITYLGVTREEVKCLITYLDEDGNQEIDLHELDSAVRRSRRQRVLRNRRKLATTSGPVDDAATVMTQPLPYQLDACLVLPAGLDLVWLHIIPQHRPDPETLVTNARRHNCSIAIELARVISNRMTLKFAGPQLDLRMACTPSPTSGLPQLTEMEAGALSRAMKRRGVNVCTR